MRLYPLFHLFTYSFYIGLETIGFCQGRADPAPGGEMRIRVVEGERVACADGEEALALIDVPLLLGQLEGLTVEELGETNQVLGTGVGDFVDPAVKGLGIESALPCSLHLGQAVGLDKTYEVFGKDCLSVLHIIHKMPLDFVMFFYFNREVG